MFSGVVNSPLDGLDEFTATHTTSFTATSFCSDGMLPLS